MELKAHDLAAWRLGFVVLDAFRTDGTPRAMIGRMGTTATGKPFVSRHPVYFGDVRLHSYQLATESAGQQDPDTVRAALATFSPVGLDQIVGKHQAFIPVPPSAVSGGLVEMLPPGRVIVQVLGDVTHDAEVKSRIAELMGKGYSFAIDDAEGLGAGDDAPGARVVRVDAGGLDEAGMVRAMDRLSKLDVEILARNVDTHERFEACRRHGFDYYQGYFFCTPHDDGRKIPQNRLSALRLLTKLRQPDIALDEMEETIESDVALSYQLLRFSNSAFIGLPRKVGSIGHAVKLVGIDRIRLWASLLMLSRMEDKPRELMITAIVRAAHCERLAVAGDFPMPDAFFTVGLLSVLDALMDRTMEEALDELPLSDELRSALLGHDGPAGAALACVLAYERNDWDQVRFMDLPPMTLRGHYLDSVGWVRRMSEGLMI